MQNIWYKEINNLQKLKTFESIHNKWFWIFNYYLQTLDFNDESVKKLFYDWDMDNWKAMHREKSEYKNYSNKQLLEDFKGDMNYCSDRMSLDRLFRNHWKFNQIFSKELLKIKYPNLWK